jgi:hypothetical protein
MGPMGLMCCLDLAIRAQCFERELRTVNRLVEGGLHRRVLAANRKKLTGDTQPGLVGPGRWRSRHDHDAEEAATVVPVPIAVAAAMVAVVVSASIVVATTVVVSAMVERVSLGGSCQTTEAGSGDGNG